MPTDDPIFDDVENEEPREAPENTDDDIQDEKPEPKEDEKQEESLPVENPFGADPQTKKIISQKYQIKELSARVKELEATKDPAEPDKSPMEQWAEENPDEEYVPASVAAKETKYWLDKNKAPAEQEPPDKLAEAQTALAQDEPSALALQLANQYISDDEFAEVRDRIADMATDEAVEFINKVASWAIQERGTDLHKGVLKNIRSKASTPDTELKGKEPESKSENKDDDSLDFAGFDDINDDVPSILNFG